MPRKAKHSSVLKVMTPVVVQGNRQHSKPSTVLSMNPNATRRKGKQRNSKTGRRPGLNSLTPNGVEFLKAATAGPDFDIISCQGIPDLYSGKSLVKKTYVNFPISVTSGNYTTIVVAPTPGVPAWLHTMGAGQYPTDVVLTPYINDDSSSMFPAMVQPSSAGSYDNTVNVSQFRYIGLQAELISTNNQNTWGGTIFCHKSSPTLTTETVGGTMRNVISGAEGCVAAFDQGGYSNTASYANTVNAGVYSCALNNHETFAFQAIRDAQNSDSSTYGFRQNVNGSGKLIFNGPVLGFGSLDTITFSISVPIDANGQSFMLRVWSVVEYIPAPGSLLYEFASISPPEDHRALAVYKSIAASLPVAVPFGDNANFWERVRKLAVNATRFFSHLPGPVGTISGAVSELIGML